MASIRKRQGKWQVQVRRLGHSAVSRTFLTRKDAEAWGRQTEVALDRSQIVTPNDTMKRCKVGDLFERYLCNVTPRKRGSAVESIRLKAMKRTPLAGASLHELSPVHLVAYRDERLAKVSAATLRREFVIIRHVMQIARREWGLPIPSDLCDMVSLPSPPRGRERRLSQDDAIALSIALKETRNPFIGPAINLALATGLRRGELLAIRWRHVDLQKRLLAVPETKTGVPRVIPLSLSAVAVLTALPKTGDEERAFPISANALRNAWDRVTSRAGIRDLHFHDLRHEAVSRLFEVGLSTPEVALISGHRDLRMLARYTHLNPERVGERHDRLLADKPEG